MPAGATQDEACRIAREAFLVFEHKEGSRMADEKYEVKSDARLVKQDQRLLTTLAMYM